LSKSSNQEYFSNLFPASAKTPKPDKSSSIIANNNLIDRVIINPERIEKIKCDMC
jgi:hypothetical protein